MIGSRPVALGFGLIAIIGVTALWAQPDRPDPDGSRLDPGTVSVRLELGVGDRQAQDWSGRVEVDKGEVLGVEGWRFRANDRVTGTNRWEAGTRTLAAGQAKTSGSQVKKKAAGKAAAGKGAAKGAAATKVAAILTNGVIVSLRAPEDATLSVETERGSFKVPLNDLADGSVRSYLDGKAQARRIPPSLALAQAEELQEDFPAAAAGDGDGQGGVWVAYVSHEARGPATLQPLDERPRSFADYAPSGGGDQVKLVHFAQGRRGRPMDVTDPGLDIWRPAVAVAGDGSVVVVWSELHDGNWDLYRRSYQPRRQAWSDRTRLTTNPGTDADPALATTPDGHVWMTWQGWVEGQADIWLAPADGSSPPVNVSDTRANEWSPALAADRSGNLHVAYDTYQAGNYDVVLRTRSAQGAMGPPIAVADSWLFEARPSVTADPRGRVWIAYEERTGNWGKDSGRLDPAPDNVLYAASNVRVRCLDGTRLLAAPDPVAQAPESDRTMNHFPRLAGDNSGRVWLAFRHRDDSGRAGNRQSSVGGTWAGQVTSLAGREWAPPQRLARSEGMLDGRASLVAPSDGSAWVVYVGDNRTVSAGDEVNANVQVAALPAGPAGKVEPVLAEVAPGSPAPASPPVHPDEAADIARVRNHRIHAGGKTYRPLRGDFHRHTEISFDGGGDGALEDMWRYAIDCAALDWIGNGDHDNGNGKEYTWWITQKTMELYHVPPAFTPMFTYERSVPYPNGHRNVMFVRRGVRPLPRLAGPTGGVHDEDTRMLYDYLGELGGICAAHTTGTDQGTDWRDNNAKVEPMVEIYQGIRSSYEHLGAPRVARRVDESVSGFEPAGMVWTALGLQYRLGFQASSDHISTHISYAVALAEDHTRAAILDAFKKRHCYAATDNILLDVRSGEHIMGDDFEASGPVELRVLAHGTRPIARLDIIKDFMYVYSTEPKRAHVELTWTDAERDRPAGVSWYYVRLIQDDGELAWGSPLWIRSSGGGRAAGPE
jgi:hypothetical protein